MTEHRKAPRRAVELEVAYERLNTFFVDYTRNVSKGGMFVSTETPLPRGTRLSLRLRIPGRSEPLPLSGEVVHASHAGGTAGMGIRFVWEDEGARVRFEQEVEARLADSLGRDAAAQLLGRRGDP